MLGLVRLMRTWRRWPGFRKTRKAGLGMVECGCVGSKLSLGLDVLSCEEVFSFFHYPPGLRASYDGVLRVSPTPLCSFSFCSGKCLSRTFRLFPFGSSLEALARLGMWLNTRFWAQAPETSHQEFLFSPGPHPSTLKQRLLLDTYAPTPPCDLS